jgi:hypothetical protein
MRRSAYISGCGGCGYTLLRDGSRRLPICAKAEREPESSKVQRRSPAPLIEYAKCGVCNDVETLHGAKEK